MPSLPQERPPPPQPGHPAEQRRSAAPAERRHRPRPRLTIHHRCAQVIIDSNYVRHFLY